MGCDQSCITGSHQSPTKTSTQSLSQSVLNKVERNLQIQKAPQFENESKSNFNVRTGVQIKRLIIGLDKGNTSLI